MKASEGEESGADEERSTRRGEMRDLFEYVEREYTSYSSFKQARRFYHISRVETDEVVKYL